VWFGLWSGDIAGGRARALVSFSLAAVLLLAPACNTQIGPAPAPDQSSDDPEAPADTPAGKDLVIESITPDRTAANFSTRVTVRGGPFGGDTTILFDDRTAEGVEVVNDQVVTAMAPIASVGFVDVTVISAGKTATRPAAFEFTQPAALQVMTIAPSNGGIEGGTRVTIRGDGFGTDSGVLFGNLAAEDIQVYDARLITATTPPHKVGNVDVTVLTNGTQVVLAKGFKYLADPVDDGQDTDGDGLTDLQETTGYEIAVDRLGFGIDPRLMVREWVTSDPTKKDSDGDGVDDFDEFLALSDPMNPDTDGDKLTDYEELTRWLTSPVSIDTDGDADGPNGDLAPNVSLFDGAELFAPDKLQLAQDDPNRTLRPRATSPSLADTDGDGRTDAEEIDIPGFSPILAELPRLDITPVGEIDIRLNKEYAETEGETEETSVTLTKSTTDTEQTSHSFSVGVSTTYSTENESEIAIIPKNKTKTTFSASLSLEYTYNHTSSTAVEKSRASSELQSKSFEQTETFSTGSIRMAAELFNPTAVSYRISEVNLLVQYPTDQRDLDGAVIGETFIPVATLRPVTQEIVLAPSETTEPIEFSATDVDGKLIEDLLKSSNTLAFDAVSFDLQTAEGLSFDFIRELTQKQTAALWIDFGDGRVDTYYVATNVARSKDSSFEGINMREIMEDVLGYPFGQANGYDTTSVNLPGGGSIKVLSSLAGLVKGQGVEGWRVTGDGEGIEGRDFSDIVLYAGDSIQLTFLRDSDGDGLPDVQEPDLAAIGGGGGVTDDVDGDGLKDLEEFVGWVAFEDPDNPLGTCIGGSENGTACVVGEAPTCESGGGVCQIMGTCSGGTDDTLPCRVDNPTSCESGGGTCVEVTTNAQGFEYRRVSSNPGISDSDGDGLDDKAEKDARTDPKNPDTDRDGIMDGVDPFPACRARTLFVQPRIPPTFAGSGSQNGSSWLRAMGSLQDALAEARTANASEDCTQHVSQIWVARGVYLPHSSDRFAAFDLVSLVGVYGGFTGRTSTYQGETKRGQRDTNPLTNGTVLSGDLFQNDLEVPTDTSVFDDPPPSNRGDNSTIVVRAGVDHDLAVLDGFMVTQAYGLTGIWARNSTATFANLLVIDNISSVPLSEFGGGAAVHDGAPVFRDTVFTRNIANGRGGGVNVRATAPAGSAPSFVDCRFEQNESRWDPAGDGGVAGGLDADYGQGGGAYVMVDAGSHVDFVRSSFVRNTAFRQGGGLYGFSVQPGVRPITRLYGQVYVEACDFNENATTSTLNDGDDTYCCDGSAATVESGGAIFSKTNMSIVNSVISGNYSLSGGGILSRLGTMYIANSTIVRNHTGSGATDERGAGILHLAYTVDDEITKPRGPGQLIVENSIVWENYNDVRDGPDTVTKGDEWVPTERNQVDFALNDARLFTFAVRNNILQEVGAQHQLFANSGNIGADPGFLDVELGDYRLKPGSSAAIDRGTNFIDILPLVPGLQTLPPLDFAGHARIQDGNGDGTATVDLGAYEAEARED